MADPRVHILTLDQTRTYCGLALRPDQKLVRFTHRDQATCMSCKSATATQRPPRSFGRL